VNASADTIWKVPAYLPYLQPPLTDEAVEAAEQRIGYKLPSEYLDLLRKQNGGYIRFSLPEMVHESIAGIGRYFPSLTKFDWDECQESVSYPLQGLVPFDGDGHWYLCLDYRNNSRTPSITHAEIEGDEEIVVAGSFADYLAMLELDIGNEYVLEGVSDVEKVIASLASSLKVGFDPPNTLMHGYPTYLVRFQANGIPEWVLVGPNSVPRGFVRPNDPRYAELKDLMPGHARRFPMAPAESYIVSTSDGVRSKVIDACVGYQLIVRPLREYVAGI
jgi:SMI1 / KNR4 family (SUKH-1)